MILCFSDPDRNWRRSVLSTYKSNRTGRKPVCYAAVKARLRGSFLSAQWLTLEADDVLGIMATNPRRGGHTIIVSQDKDLKTIPGCLYNPDKPDLGVVTITHEEADRWHMMQTLTGDRTDGYAGCPGVGQVRAEQILAKSAHLWTSVCTAYGKANLGEEEALRQARVARILRWQDYASEQQKVILWVPPSAMVAR